MNKIGWFSRLFEQQPSGSMVQRVAGSIAVTALFMMTGVAYAQGAAPGAATPGTPMSIPDGYVAHHSVDLGGRMTNVTGSPAMYGTMVNMQSGPRVMGETFEMHALPGNKHALADAISAFGTGFGGDPYNSARLNAYKGKIYEFSGLFRRDRQYFDYDLLGNPNIAGGQAITDSTTGVSVPFSQATQSPFLYNTVRRMTDTNLTLLPLSKFTFRAAYSQNVFEGPSLSPSGFWESSAPVTFINDFQLSEYQRNSTDDFTGAIDWKPVKGTKLTYEEQVDHYKGDSFFTLAPSAYNVTEPDGSKAALLVSYDAFTAPTSASLCNASSMGGSPFLTTNPNGGQPIVNPACDVTTSYARSAPTRILYPTEIFRLQSTSIPNVSMNGDARYTRANMNQPSYYEDWQGLTAPGKTVGSMRSLAYAGNANAKREVIAADYGIIWQTTKSFSLADQIDFSNVHQPGISSMTSAVALTTPTGDNSLAYSGPLTPTTGTAVSMVPGSAAIGTPLPGYFGQMFMTNNVTASWDATPRTTFSLTYRYGDHVIAEGVPHNAALATGAITGGTVTIHENGGIFNAAVRPTVNWNINGSIEVLYDDNSFTPVGPRQIKHYRLHTIYRPKTWATITGAFNDRERHNNTDNITAAPADGLLNHIDYSRVVSMGAVLQPNEHYGIDFNYSYSDVYTTTNICYDAGASITLPGAAPANGALCPGATIRGTAPAQYEFGPVKDFMDAPTQSGSVAFNVSPIDKIHSNIGYRVSSVNGNQFFNDSRSVNGSLDSTYESPFVNLAWTVRPGLIWKAEYNFFGYGEGGPSGAPYCASSNPTAASPTVPVVSCASEPYPTGLNEPSSGLTAPRNFHANNVTLGVHYEF